MNTDSPVPRSFFVPTPAEDAARSKIYGYLQIMRELKDTPMPHFQTGPEGPRSFNQYLDDSERILNGYTLSREAQGKEDWQSNLLDNISRAKLRAIAAGVGLKVPGIRIKAINKEGIYSVKRAEIVKNATKQTYTDDNPTLNSFREVWHMMSHGVIFEYEGYRTGGAMQEVVESFDSITGEVKTKKEYRKMDGKPFSTIINPQEFYWWTFFVDEIQKQPRIAWVQHYNRRELELEFSKFENYKYVKDRQEAADLSQLAQQSLYFDTWNEHVADRDDFMVVRYYSKADDGSDGDVKGYEVWVNGVPMMRCPLLWGEREKAYPFAKQISEPFANTNFFVGMSLPGILEAYQDGKNTVLNTLIDKLYRAIDPLKLVGLQNRDLLDVESQITSQDNTIYVPDINAVKFMDHPGINQGELAMLTILDRGIESSSIDRAQQGVASATKKTATQSEIEDVRAQEIKGMLYMFLEDLWLQKTRLRVRIILSHYLKDKAAQDEVRGRIISIKDYTFGDGSRGVLDIYVAKNKRDRLSEQEIEAREAMMEEQGIAYKLISMDADYLDDYQYDIEIEPASFEEKEQKEEKEELMSEINEVTVLFPEFFASNKEKYLRDLLKVHGRNFDEYNPPAELPPPMPMQPEPAVSPMAPAPAPQPTESISSVLGLS